MTPEMFIRRALFASGLLYGLQLGALIWPDTLAVVFLAAGFAAFFILGPVWAVRSLPHWFLASSLPLFVAWCCSLALTILTALRWDRLAHSQGWTTIVVRGPSGQRLPPSQSLMAAGGIGLMATLVSSGILGWAARAITGRRAV